MLLTYQPILSGGGGTIAAVPAFTPVADEASMLALPDVLGQVARRDDLDFALYTQILVPATDINSWKPDAAAQIDVPLATMGEAISAGMPIRIATDGLGYKAFAGGVTPPVEFFSDGVTGMLGLAGGDYALGDPARIRTESFTQDDWTAVIGTALLTAGQSYFLSDTTPGMLVDDPNLLDQSSAGGARTLARIGTATSPKTLVWDLYEFAL
jgi:hypothetical protein